MPGEDDDKLARDLATFLAATVEPSGAVPGIVGHQRGPSVPGAYSLYFTGETMWALARIGHAAADAIAEYMPGRDEVEDLFPPTPDHWASYGWAELAAAGRPPHRGAARPRPPARRHLRRGGARRVDPMVGGRPRGVAAPGRGVGLRARHDRRGHRRAAAPVRHATTKAYGRGAGRRVSCVAGMLVERQADGPGPGQRGAWFTRGVTRMDDQQHALSALLAAEPALAVPPAPAAPNPVGGGEEPWGSPSSSSPCWRQRTRPASRDRRGRRASPSPAPTRPWSLLAALSGPIADLLSLSPASVRLAAGAVLARRLARRARGTGRRLARRPGRRRGGWSSRWPPGIDNGVLLIVAARRSPAAAAALWLPDRRGGGRSPLVLVAAMGAAVAISLVVDGVLGV